MDEAIKKVNTMDKILNELMAKKNITMNALADELQISRRSMRNFTHGYSIPKTKNIYRLAKYFEVSPFYLMGYDVDKNYQPVPEDEVKFMVDNLTEKGFNSVKSFIQSTIINNVTRNNQNKTLNAKDAIIRNVSRSYTYISLADSWLASAYSLSYYQPNFYDYSDYDLDEIEMPKEVLKLRYNILQQRIDTINFRLKNKLYHEDHTRRYLEWAKQNIETQILKVNDEWSYLNNSSKSEK